MIEIENIKVGDYVIANRSRGIISHIYKGSTYIIDSIINHSRYCTYPRIKLKCPDATGAWALENFDYRRIKATKLAKLMYPNRAEKDGWLL